MIIAICVPSNNIEHADKYLFSERSLSNIEPLFLKGKVCFSIVAQGDDWKKYSSIIETRLKSFNIDYRILFQNETNPCQIFKLRHQSFYNFRTAKYFISVDDNIQFSEGTKKFPENSGYRYGQCIDYLENNPNCGIVNCVGSLGGNLDKYEIKRYDIGKEIATAKGLVIRNVCGGRLFPSETLDFYGCREELIMALNFNRLGYYTAKQFNNPTKHKELHSWKSVLGQEVSEKDNNNLHNVDLTNEYALKWIRQNFDEKYVFSKTRIINKYI